MWLRKVSAMPLPSMAFVPLAAMLALVSGSAAVAAAPAELTRDEIVQCVTEQLRTRRSVPERLEIEAERFTRPVELTVLIPDEDRRAWRRALSGRPYWKVVVTSWTAPKTGPANRLVSSTTTVFVDARRCTEINIVRSGK